MTAQLIRETLEQGHMNNQSVALWLLVKLQGEITEPGVIDLYDNGDQDTRWLIIEAMKIYQLPGLSSRLIEAAADKALQTGALEALGAMRDTQALNALDSLIAGDNEQLANEARAAKEQITGKAEPRSEKPNRQTR
jgi:hypothetical protein